jgi:hypothetical protein
MALIESLAKQGANPKEIAAVVGWKNTPMVGLMATQDAAKSLRKTCRQQRSRETKARFESPTYTEKFREAVVVGWQNKNRKKRFAERVRAMWAEAGFKERWLESVKAKRQQRQAKGT